MTIKVRACRRFKLNGHPIRAGQIFDMPANQFADHGPNGTGLVEAHSPSATVKAAAKKVQFTKELKQ